jgi:hypothetical protein
MPIDTRPISGYLQIDITSQVLDDVNGVFRVSINNTKRGELLLYPGVAGRSLVVPLSPSELAKERLVVSFSTLGTHATQSCTSKDGISSIVEVETTSGLFLELDGAVVTPRDRFFSNGGIIPIAWSNDFSSSEKIKVIQLASDLMREKHKVVFDGSPPSDALISSELMDLKNGLPELKIEPTRWPYPVAKRGANFGLRRFYETTNWRIKYQPHSFPEQSLPKAFDLHMTLSGIRANEVWTIAVTLNGYLIHQDTIGFDQRSYRTSIPLAQTDQTANNLIEVTLSSSQSNEGICNEGPILLAQLEQDSALLKGDKHLEDTLFELRQTLENYSVAELSSLTSITENQVNTFARTIATVVPSSMQVTEKPNKVKIKLLERATFPDLVSGLSDKLKYWVAYFNDSDELKVVRLMETDRERLPDVYSPNAVLISVPKTGADR